MSNGINHLEGALSVWEDCCYLMDLLNRGYAATLPPTAGFRSLVRVGATANFSKFRQHLLGSLDAEFDLKTFGEYSIPNPDAFPDLQSIARIPPALFGWCRNSRRIFNLSQDLYLVLACTDNQGVTWQDIDLPFPDFALKLPYPIKRNDGLESDAVLVNTMPLTDGHQYLKISLLPNDLLRYTRIGNLARKHLQSLLHKGRWSELRKEVLMIFEKFGQYATFDQATIDRVDMSGKQAFSPFSQTVGPEAKNRVSLGLNAIHLDEAVRLVACFCLYLTTLPPAERHNSLGSRVKPTEPRIGRSIKDVAEVCSMGFHNVLTPEERQAFTEEIRLGSDRVVSAHFRRGHWRRAPGTADDPDAPKIVHVRPTIVRRDRLGPGELPGGSESKVE